jgi:hypothetical protein
VHAAVNLLRLVKFKQQLGDAKMPKILKVDWDPGASPPP